MIRARNLIYTLGIGGRFEGADTSCDVCGRPGTETLINRVSWVFVASSLPQHGGASRPYWAAGCGCPNHHIHPGCEVHRCEDLCPDHTPDLSRPALQMGLFQEAA